MTGGHAIILTPVVGYISAVCNFWLQLHISGESADPL